jgi:hypothetical protein
MRLQVLWLQRLKELTGNCRMTGQDSPKPLHREREEERASCQVLETSRL